MLPEIDRFVNWVRRRHPRAHTRRDYRVYLSQFALGELPWSPTTYLYHVLPAPGDPSSEASSLNLT
jgi:hypothetical protein